MEYVTYLKQKVDLLLSYLIGRSPPPNKYRAPTDFKKDGKKGPLFGLGRKEVGKAFLITNPPVCNALPGPGTYNTIAEPGKGSPHFSMRTRTADGAAQTTTKIVPGPGNYPIYPSISPKGQHLFSKYRNSAATLFNPPRSERFKTISIKRYNIYI